MENRFLWASSSLSCDFCSVGKKPGKAINIVTLVIDPLWKIVFFMQNFPNTNLQCSHYIQLKLKWKFSFIVVEDIFFFHCNFTTPYDSIFHDAHIQIVRPYIARELTYKFSHRIFLLSYRRRSKHRRPFSSFHIFRYWASANWTQTIGIWLFHLVTEKSIRLLGTSTHTVARMYYTGHCHFWLLA